MKTSRMKIASPNAAAYRNLGYRSQLHYTVTEAANYFGLKGNSQFHKMMASPEYTPTPPDALGTDRLRYYRKVDIHAMADTFPYWAKRRYYAMTDFNGLHRIKLSSVKVDQIPLPLPTPTPIPKKVEKVTAKVEPTPTPVPMTNNVADISTKLDQRIAGVKLATSKYGMSIEEAAVLAKTGLFDS